VFGDDIHFRFDGELRPIDATLVTRGVVIRQLSVQSPGLEDVFLQLIGRGEPEPTPMHFDSTPVRTGRVSVECREVSRRFDTFAAVDRVDLSVRHGEIFGLLGPNGAGKTTLIKMMCGLLEPTAGTILIGGVNVRTERGRVWTAIGYMSQRFSLYQDLSVRQNLRLYADLYGVAPHVCASLMATLGLEPFASRLARDLPTGVRQRLSLLCAVLHHPPIVFLDEPTSGVDPQARRAFWDLIYSLSREAGATVLVSTHYMDEATHCDRLGLMDQGRVIAIGSPAELRQTSERRSGSLLAVEADDIRHAYRTLLRDRPGVTWYGNGLHVRSVNPEADAVALTTLLERDGIGRVHIHPIPLSMDEAFIDFIQASENAHA
jgi:ABC-2 type transport system ATP-binding protein